MSKKIYISSSKLLFLVLLVLTIGFVAGTRFGDIQDVISPASNNDNRLELSELQDVYKTLKQHYNGTLDEADLIEGAKRGLVGAVDDDYTVYLDAKEAADFKKDLNGEVGGGIGAEIGMRNGQATVIRVLQNNPAYTSGLHAGDAIVAVNETAVIGWDVDRVVKLIRGKEGTTVKLTVKRDEESKVFTITRAKIDNPSISSEVKDGVGIMTLNRFDEDTVQLALETATKLKRQNVRGVIVDLRGNGGGVLEAAQGVAGLWLKDKVVVKVKGKGDSRELRSIGNDVLRGTKTVVLVNGSSASASEIVTGALKDYGVATIVGETTFGKGTVQELIPLRHDSLLKVTIQRWYTPKGKNISKNGIKPDVTVPLTQKDLDAQNDRQLNAALEHLK